MSNIKVGDRVNIVCGEHMHNLKINSLGIISKINGFDFIVKGVSRNSGSIIIQRLIGKEFKLINK